MIDNYIALGTEQKTIIRMQSTLKILSNPVCCFYFYSCNTVLFVKNLSVFLLRGLKLTATL